MSSDANKSRSDSNASHTSERGVTAERTSAVSSANDPIYGNRISGATIFNQSSDSYEERSNYLASGVVKENSGSVDSLGGHRVVESEKGSDGSKASS